MCTTSNEARFVIKRKEILNAQEEGDGGQNVGEEETDETPETEDEVEDLDDNEEEDEEDEDV